MRNKFEIFKNPLKICMCILNILFIACLTNVFIGGGKVFGVIDNYTVLIIAIALSWLAMRPISGYAWILLLIGSISSLGDANKAMGVYGAIFLLCAFVSVGKQIASGFLVVNINELKAEFSSAKEIISYDVNASVDATKDALNTVKEITSPKISKFVKDNGEKQ